MMKVYRVTLLLLILISIGCANREKAIYQSLQVSQAAYENVTDEIELRYERGRITRSELKQLAPLAERWGRTHNAAVESFKQYKLAEDEVALETVMRLIADANRIILEIEKLLDSWGMAVLE